MAVTERFRSAVESNDIMAVRIMMKDSLLVDTSFSEYNDMEAITKNLPGLYDEHDGRELEAQESLWNTDYMNRLMVGVVGNFSKERLDHLKKVIRHLNPVRPASNISASGSTSSGGQYGRSASQQGGASFKTQQQVGRSSKTSSKRSGTKYYKTQKQKDMELIMLGAACVVGGAVVGGIVGATVESVAAGVVAGVATVVAAGALVVIVNKRGK